MDQTQLSQLRKGRGKHFSVEDKVRILSVFKVCSENNPSNNKTENVALTAKAAGICVASVHNILREYNKDHRLHPPKVYCRKRKVLDNISDLTKNKLRRLVHSFFEINEQPTLNKILVALHEDEDMPDLKKTSLRLLLKEIGFNNLQVKPVDTKNININKVMCGNELNSDSIQTKHCKVDNPNEDETKNGQKPEDITEYNAMECVNISDIIDNNKAQEENVMAEKVLDEIKYEFLDEIVKEEPEYNYAIINIKSELQSEVETKNEQKPEVIKEYNTMECVNISDITHNNKAQEEKVIAGKVLDEIKYEFIDEIVKEEPEENFYFIEIKSELQNDAFLNN